VVQLVAEIFQIAPEQVGKEKCPEVANVGIVVDGRPTDVHSDTWRVEGLKWFESLGQGIV
jgi:hypothetical protein